jgi:hypothetical protein
MTLSLTPGHKRATTPSENKSKGRKRLIASAESNGEYRNEKESTDGCTSHDEGLVLLIDDEMSASYNPIIE